MPEKYFMYVFCDTPRNTIGSNLIAIYETVMGAYMRFKRLNVKVIFNIFVFGYLLSLMVEECFTRQIGGLSSLLFRS